MFMFNGGAIGGAISEKANIKVKILVANALPFPITISTQRLLPITCHNK